MALALEIGLRQFCLQLEFHLGDGRESQPGAMPDKPLLLGLVVPYEASVSNKPHSLISWDTKDVSWRLP